MGYSIAATFIVLLHLAFILFAIFGGLLNIRWRNTWLVHIPALAWGAFVEISGRVCPLTTLENHFRAAAGQKGYEGGFIDQMLLSVIYPDLPPWTHAAMGIGLLLFNVLLYVYLLRTRTIQKGLRNYDP